MILEITIDDTVFAQQVAEWQATKGKKPLVLSAGVEKIEIKASTAAYMELEYFPIKHRDLHRKDEGVPELKCSWHDETVEQGLKELWQEDQPVALGEGQSYGLARMKYDTTTIRQSAAGLLAQISEGVKGFVRPGTFSELANGVAKTSYVRRINILARTNDSTWVRLTSGNKPHGYYDTFGNDELLTRTWCCNSDWILCVVDTEALSSAL